ncbi:heavy-metal-associated domain-containing protein [Nitratifractor salsuginis]|uniref:Heavy metal transport/detoxification protein n=1 Tax=Nitratifractor salsuginis (strain DSM 16511 / JCM 12458 / E9I37-1) TaxID=749222 RepID=E6WZJ7_NITSE|nr:heavy metal-associated domain-containing protein [Nitratifractor salsuginis]ADV45577.1 Heavy metal transport/detoxification protein [Nitratifractor salsuginis DSM 16511]
MKKILLSAVLLAGILQADKIAVIEVEGMTCPLCTVAIKRSLKKTEGVYKAKVKLNTRKATVRFRDDLNTSRLLQAIEKAGYKGKILSVSPAEPQP